MICRVVFVCYIILWYDWMIFGGHVIYCRFRPGPKSLMFWFMWVFWLWGLFVLFFLLNFVCLFWLFGGFGGYFCLGMFVCLFSWFVVCLLFYTFILKGLKKADIFNYGIFLTTNLAKLSCGLWQLIATGESSIVFKIATSTRSLFTLS